MLEIFKEKLKEYKFVLSVFVVIVSCLFLVLIVSGIAGIINKIKESHYIGADVAYKNTISVTGEGKIYTKPDIAFVNLSVVTEGKNIGDVQDKNTKKMNKVISFLKNFGIAEKDIKTTNYQIYPRYNYENRTIPQIIGYEITQTLEVKIRDLTKVGEILENSVDAGINQVSSLRFGVDKDEEVKAEARKLAIEDAKKKAEKLASQLGIKLVKISGFTEDTGYYPVPMYKEAMGIGGGGEAPNIQVGENEIIVNVILIYEID